MGSWIHTCSCESVLLDSHPSDPTALTCSEACGDRCASWVTSRPRSLVHTHPCRQDSPAHLETLLGTCLSRTLHTSRVIGTVSSPCPQLTKCQTLPDRLLTSLAHGHPPCTSLRLGDSLSAGRGCAQTLVHTQRRAQVQVQTALALCRKDEASPRLLSAPRAVAVGFAANGE